MRRISRLSAILVLAALALTASPSTKGQEYPGGAAVAQQAVPQAAPNTPSMEAPEARAPEELTPLVGGFVENIMMRVTERAMARRAAGRIAATGGSKEEADAAAVREARTAAKERIAKSPATYGALRALSFAMKLDLVLFGRITSGPFFALLTKDGAR